MTKHRNWYKVRDLIARLQELPADAHVLLTDGIWDAQKAGEHTSGFPPGLESVGLNSVQTWGGSRAVVFLVHSTKPDEGIRQEPTE